MSKCKTVTLRKRKIKNGTQYSLCLDYYPGYRDNVTMRVITREALGIYIFAKPANQQERDFNARMMKKAVILRNQRYEAIFNENNGFLLGLFATATKTFGKMTALRAIISKCPLVIGSNVPG